MIEKQYLKIKETAACTFSGVVPYFRRLLRFLALPYCYFTVINWEICTRSRVLVAWDLLYIFFRYKYYPENYTLCHLWKKDPASWKNYYGSIYDAYQRGRLRKDVQRKEYEILFEDKNVCYQLCKAADLPLPKQYACLSPQDDYVSMINEAIIASPSSELIIKPVIGRGGKGIFLVFCDHTRGGIFVRDTRGNNVDLGLFRLSEYSVLQERLRQPKIIEEIAQSLNTFRIVTLLTKSGNVLILGTRIRFGISDSFVDNTSNGGIGVGVHTDTGKLMKEGFDSKGRIFTSHPTSGAIFEKVQVPEWEKIIHLVKRIQINFPYYKLLGHDIALTDTGPVIIEINAAHDNIMLEQNCGPILENEETKRAFAEYDLLLS